MIHYKRVLTDQDSLFPFCWDLYESAFPEIERRLIDYHKETMQVDIFHADVVFDDADPIGILFWWDLNEFRFIEHFATMPSLRGRGYGDMILRDFISKSDKQILLEVEHPTEDLNIRRIGFYERIGFVLNSHEYSHPSYQQLKDTFVSLMIMTYPEAISSERLQKFVEEFPKIHFRSY